MPVSNVASASPFTAAAAGGTNNASADKNQFLKLLVTQLQNQDPLAPTDQKEMLAQLAQFSTVEQLQSLNQNFSNSSGFAQMAQSAALIGKTVSAPGADGQTVQGVVASVSLIGGKPYLHVGNSDIDASAVTKITQ